MSRIVTVPVTAPYCVQIGRGLLGRTGELLAGHIAPCAVVLVADDTVDRLYGETVADALAQAGFRVLRFRFLHGEPSKNLQTLSELLEFMAGHGVTRSDLVVALGGGVTSDLAGFAAAVYLRGISYVSLPTTLLAAVDASVGGKTAVNLSAGKNLCGAFHQPLFVLCDCDTFDTLPPQVLTDGVAEALKYGVLADKALFSALADGHSPEAMEEVVARCVALKSRYVVPDEHDAGVRQYLNLGHTIGHAFEKLSGFSVGHGHAVAAGMAIMARASERLGLAEEPVAQPVCSALKRNALPTETPYDTAALAEVALSDKKRRGGEITLVVPLAVGRAKLHTIPTRELAAFFAAGREERT